MYPMLSLVNHVLQCNNSPSIPQEKSFQPLFLHFLLSAIIMIVL